MYEYKEDNKAKEEFLKAYEDNKVFYNFTNNIFNKSKDYEEKFKKDVSSFSVEEIVEFLKSLNSKSSESLRVKVSMLRRYTEFVIQNKNLTTNNYDAITTDILYECVGSAIEDKYISPSVLNYYINELPNPSDQFVLLAIYEGLKGEKYSDLTLSTKENLDMENNIFNTPGGRKLKCSAQLMEIAESSANTYIYHSITVTNAMTIIRLVNNRILKTRDNATKDTLERDYLKLQKKLRTIREYLNAEHLTMPSLIISGFVYNLKKINEKYNYDLKKLMTTREYEELAVRYVYEKYAYSRIKVIIKDYLTF